MYTAMKKFHYLLMSSAVVASALVACNKTEIEAVPPQNKETVLTFISEKPEITDETQTRTSWDADTKTIKWSRTDKIRVALKVGENWQNATGDATADKGPKLYESNQAGADASIIDFKVPTNFKVTTEGDYKFYGIYPSSVTPNDANFSYMPSIAVTLPTEQEPAAGTFDASGDIMISESTETYTSIPEEAIKLDWQRIVAHGDITLKKLPTFEDGEVIRSITLTAQEGADLTGEHYLMLTTGEFSGTKGVNYVTIKAKDDNLVKNADGNIKFWFTSLPFTATSLEAKITTNKYVYTKAYTGISKEFLVNTRNILGISMAKCTKETAPAEQLIQDGVYVISTGDMMMVANPSDKYQNAAALSTTLEEGKLRVEDEAAWRVVFDADNAVYNIQSVAYETYLGGLATSGADLKLVAASDKVNFTIEESGEGYHVVGPNSRWIGYNSSATPARFAMYNNDASQPGIITFSPAKYNDTPVLEIADINLGSASAVTEATAIIPTSKKFIARIVVNGVFSDQDCTTAATWLSVSYTGGALVYTAEANTSTTSERKAYVSVKGVNENGVETDDVVFIVTQPKLVSYSDKWVLVTSTSDLANGDKIVIVNKGGTLALSTTQNSNNRGAVAVSLDANDNKIVNISSDTQQITLGQANGNWTFAVNGGYLYAASSSSNHLKTQSENNANGQWKIVINNSTFEATITAQGSNTRNVIQNNGNIFACYGSASQTAVKIYKYHADERPAAPISWSDNEGLAEITDNGIDYALPSLYNEGNLSITFDSSDKTVATIDEDGVVVALKEGTTSISATFTADANSQYKTTKVEYVLSVTDSRTGQSEPVTYTYVFTNREWGATLNEVEANWTSVARGSSFTAGQGTQVSTSANGANANSPVEFTKVSKIVVTYCTNNKAGKGTIKVKVGDGTQQSFSVSAPSSGGTTLKTTEFSFSPTENGTVNLAVDCSTNSLYIYSIAITAD
jgi:hypothetical protein